MESNLSSQSRYDHFDTAPYLSQHQHLGKRGELMGRTSKNIKLRIPEKTHKIKGFRSGSYRVATTISSAAPSTTRTTLRVYFHPVFFPEICSKNSLERKQERRQKIFDFEIFCVEEYQGESGGRNSQLLPKFRVSPVMTTSIPLRVCQTACAVCFQFMSSRLSISSSISMLISPMRIRRSIFILSTCS